MRLTLVLFLIGCMGSAYAERLSLEEYKNKQYEGLKKGDWVKISLNSEWTKRQTGNWPRAVTSQEIRNLRPQAIDIMTIWGSVNNKTKDYLVVTKYYTLRRKREFGKISNTPSPYGIEKQQLKNTQIKPTEIESITAWMENEDPALPTAGRK